MMKKMNRAVAAAALCMAVTTALSGCAGTAAGTSAAGTGAAGAAVTAQEQNQGIITVSGREEVKAVPDMAEVIYGIHTQEAEAQACQQKNAQELEKAIEVLKGLGVEETSIQTSSYGMNPIHNWNSENQEITGYEMNTAITVSDIPIDRLGEILSKSVEAGVNQVDSVSYFSSQYDQYFQEALTLAVAMAKQKAETLAAAAGKTVGEVVSVREEGYWPESRYAPAKILGQGAVNAVAEDMAVMPGEISVEAQVTVDFLLQ